MDKPKCFGKYEATFPGNGKVCRACPFAQECKITEPKRGRPSKTKESQPELMEEDDK